MLDFYADWCVSCKEMERYTFSDEAVRDAACAHGRFCRPMSRRTSMTTRRCSSASIYSGRRASCFSTAGGSEIDGCAWLASSLRINLRRRSIWRCDESPAADRPDRDGRADVRGKRRMVLPVARQADRPPDATAAGNMVLGAKLMGVDDKAHPFEQWRGKVLVVNFWATWCAPCREEIPGFIKFQERYRAGGCPIRRYRDRPEAAGNTVCARDGHQLSAGGRRHGDHGFARQLGNRASVLPFTLVLDRTGKVVLSEVGILKADKLEKTVKPLL